MSRFRSYAACAVLAAGSLAASASAADLVLRSSTNPVVTASVNLNPGPGGTDADPLSALVGPLQGGTFDNFTFGAAGIDQLNPDPSTITLQRTTLYVQGETFNAAPFQVNAAIGTGLQTSGPIGGDWIIDVVAGPGEVIGDRVRIDITADVAGSLNAFGDNLEARANWLVRTDHGVVLDGSGEVFDDSASFSEQDCLSFTVRVGESFSVSMQLAVEALGDSDGPSQGGDASASITTGAVTIAATSDFTPVAMITPLTQVRSVSGSAFASDPNGNGVSDGDFEQALDFAPFAGSASASATFDESFGQGGGNQNSNIRIFEINARGASFANGESFGFGGGYADGSGSSTFDVSFELAAQVEFALSNYMAAYDDGYVYVELWRDGDPNAVFYREAYGPSDERSDVVYGTLSPGVYRLLCDSNSSAYGDSFQPGYAFSEFDTSFKVGARFCNACAGDLNGDLVVDLSDLATLLTNFGLAPALPEDGDVDFDGDVDVSDLAGLLAAFGSNCQ